MGISEGDSTRGLAVGTGGPSQLSVRACVCVCFLCSTVCLSSWCGAETSGVVYLGRQGCRGSCWAVRGSELAARRTQLIHTMCVFHHLWSSILLLLSGAQSEALSAACVLWYVTADTCIGTYIGISEVYTCVLCATQIYL